MDLFTNPLVLAKHAAEREMRDAFQNRFGLFWKCGGCGAYLAPVSPRDMQSPLLHAHGGSYRTGYATFAGRSGCEKCGGRLEERGDVFCEQCSAGSVAW